jgi:hypothetical protein
MEVSMTQRIHSLTPEEINAIVARAREERAKFVAQLLARALAVIKGWLHRAPATKPPRPGKPLASANA